MAEPEPYGEEGDDEASTILMKLWGPWLRIHSNTPFHTHTLTHSFHTAIFYNLHTFSEDLRLIP